MESIAKLESCRLLRETRPGWFPRNGRGAPSYRFRTLSQVRKMAPQRWTAASSHTVHVCARDKARTLRQSLGAVGIGTIGVTIALARQSANWLLHSMQPLSYFPEHAVEPGQRPLRHRCHLSCVARILESAQAQNLGSTRQDISQDL
jgi:hypothetical protein